MKMQNRGLNYRGELQDADLFAEAFPRRAHKAGGIPAPNDPFAKTYPIIQADLNGGFEYTIYIHDEIGSPFEFTEIIDLLDSAKSNDLVKFLINSPGGELRSTIMVLDSMKHCEAQVVVECAGTIASAGTMFALGGSGLYIADHSKFMVHYYSGGIGGKGNEIIAAADYAKVEYPKFFHEVYKDFMTVEEIDRVIGGEDRYFTADEVRDRWEKVIAVKEANILKQHEDAEEVQKLALISQVESFGLKVTKPRKPAKKKK